MEMASVTPPAVESSLSRVVVYMLIRPGAPSASARTDPCELQRDGARVFVPLNPDPQESTYGDAKPFKGSQSDRREISAGVRSAGRDARCAAAAAYSDRRARAEQSRW